MNACKMFQKPKNFQLTKEKGGKFKNDQSDSKNFRFYFFVPCSNLKNDLSVNQNWQMVFFWIELFFTPDYLNWILGIKVIQDEKMAA